MSLFRNKEMKHWIKFLVLISIIQVTIGFVISTWTGLLTLITVILLCILFYYVTLYRYRQIKKLSDYLRRISSGDYSLDIRDNAEGELSILKSEIYKVTLMLSEYNEQLVNEKLLLSDQMSEISHQLKTPLTSMMVMVDLLQNEDLPNEKRREFTTILHTQLERIEWLVSSLLKMSKLDADVVMMKRENVPVKKLIENSLKPLLIPMELKDITYHIDVRVQFVSCDFKWTTEAIINIVKNCIEHTPNGGRITLIAQDNPIYFELIISDNGTGIPKEDLPHIFTRFYRGKNASPDSVGIGLAMSYRIMKSQQGDILVKSELGQGSSFSFRFYKSVI